MARYNALSLLSVLVATAVTGCAANSSSQRREVSYAPTQADIAPEERAELLRRVADEAGVEGATEAELRRALGALEELEALEGRSRELTLRQARVLLFLVEPMTDEDEVVSLCRRGEALAERLRRDAPDAVEGYYYGALFLGMRARHQQLRAAFFLRDLESFGRRAVELDQEYDDGGPLRFLGMFLISAPSFPYGPGDPDEGIELLERAVALDDYPLNRVLLARGLVENDEHERACAELNAAYDAPSEGRWAITRDRWRRDVEQLASRIECRVETEPSYAAAR